MPFAAIQGVLTLFAILALSACMNEPEGSIDYFSLEGSPSLTGYSRVSIRLDDTTGALVAMLYDDSLPSLARLNRLPAGPYQGGTVRIVIEGYQLGRLVYREIRLYDGRNQRVLALDISHDADILPVDSGAVIGKPAAQAPAMAVFPHDTIVSIRDSVPLPAEVTDMDGDLAGYSWDCNGDGKPDDSAAIYGGRAKIHFGVRFNDAGARTCVLKVWDLSGKSTQAKVGVKTVQDPPWADAGRDTTVVVKTGILLHAKGEDGYGPIVSRGWRIGAEDFRPVTQQETSIQAPEMPGDLICILKVTDTDSLSGYDTLVVHVVYSPDNTLSDLKTSPGVITPAFRKDIRAYGVTLAHADSLLTLIPRTSESHATVVVQSAIPGAQKADSGALPIAVGENIFTVQVTAQDGSTLQYTITARRD